MPKRKKANRSGDIGEIRVIERFIEIGAAVNSLAQSDYGWDAHIHTPKDALAPNADEDVWEMSGLTAHVQIKNSESGSQAKVKVGSLRVSPTRPGVETRRGSSVDSRPAVVHRHQAPARGAGGHAVHSRDRDHFGHA